MRVVGYMPFLIIASELDATEKSFALKGHSGPARYAVVKKVDGMILIGYEREDGTKSRQFSVTPILYNGDELKPLETIDGWVRLHLEEYQTLTLIGLSGLKFVDSEM